MGIPIVTVLLLYPALDIVGDAGVKFLYYFFCPLVGFIAGITAVRKLRRRRQRLSRKEKLLLGLFFMIVWPAATWFYLMISWLLCCYV